MGLEVSAEADDPQARLWHCCHLTSLQGNHAALRTDEVLPLSASDQATFACLRTSLDGDALVIVNLKSSPIRYGEGSLDSGSLLPGECDLLALRETCKRRPSRSSPIGT